MGVVKVVITGDKELDAKLKSLAPALQRKFIRGALRRNMKRAEREFKKIVDSEAHDTGAYEGATKIFSMKRSRERIGSALYVSKRKLFAAYAEEHEDAAGNPKLPHPAKGKSVPFYYPEVLEFGDAHHKPIRAQRRALYDHQAAYRAEFINDVHQFIDEQKVTSSLPKE